MDAKDKANVQAESRATGTMPERYSPSTAFISWRTIWSSPIVEHDVCETRGDSNENSIGSVLIDFDRCCLDVVLFHSRSVHAQSSRVVTINRVTVDANGSPKTVTVLGNVVVGISCVEGGSVHCYVASSIN
jgi:hypothetical protein